MKKTLQISENNIACYELEIMQAGCCKGLVPLHFVRKQGFFAAELELAGLTSVDGWLCRDRNYVFEAYRRLLQFLQGLAISLRDAERFLIPPEHLSLAPGEIFLDGDHPRLIPQENLQHREALLSQDASSSLEEKFEKLLSDLDRQYPQTHASYILEQLPEHYDPAFLLRFFSEIALNSYV